MSQATTTSTTQQPMIAILRVGFGTPFIGTGEKSNPLYAHLKRLEAQFGMPFYLHPFNWMTHESPDIRPEHAGRYHFVSFKKEHYDLSNAIFEWIDNDKEAHYPYACGINFYAPH